MNKKTKTLLFSLLIGLFFASLFGLDFFSSWRFRLTDKLFLQKIPSEEIVIVAIDNESLQKIGRWPWDRKTHAEFLEKISAMSPKIIGYDVNFPEKSSEESDKKLAEAIKNSGKVVLPAEAEIEIREKAEAEKMLFPMTEIRKASFGIGVTNTLPDADGIFRRIPLKISFEEKEYEHFDYLIAKKYLEQKEKTAEIKNDELGRLFINYSGRPGTFKKISFSDILEGKTEPEKIEGKIVLVGATAPDLHDEQLTPVSAGQPMSGVEIHANAISTILTNSYLVHLGKIWQILIIIFFAALVGLIIARTRIFQGIFLVLFLCLAYLFLALAIFDYGIILDLFYPFATILFAYLIILIWRHIAETKEKAHIKKAFSQYVLPEVIEEIIASPEKLKLGGEKKEITILFSDIRGFTSISEKLSPEELVHLLNKYLTEMTNIIMDSRGVVDKYIGDAIMAFWGAPIAEPNHAKVACQAALGMTKTLKKEKEKWKKEFGVELSAGIGINTGSVIIGNMGSDRRFDYTVMGDSVNLASRLESITKIYGVSIVVSEFTRKSAGEEYVFRFLDKVAVKGKKEGVEIYELIGIEGETENYLVEFKKEFEEGIEFYKKRKWKEGLEYFNNLAQKYPNDLTARIYLERFLEFQKNPPGEDWDGIYRLNVK